MRVSLWVPILAVLACGCGGGSGDHADPAPTLVSISISPDSPVVDAGNTVTLTCLGTYSSGAEAAVSADWTNLDEKIVSLSDVTGTSVTVTALLAGTATVKAAVGGHSASATVRVNLSAGFLGADAKLGLIHYPLSGGPPSAVDMAPVPFDWAYFGGAAPAGDGIYLLYAGFKGSPPELWFLDLTTNAASFVAETPDTETHSSITVSSDGIVFVLTFTGTVSAYDPVGQTFKVVSTVPSKSATSIEADEKGNVYVLDALPYDPWVWKLSPGNNYEPKEIVNIPAAGVAGGGLAVSPDGETIFVGEGIANVVYRCDDLDGDGAFTSPGEMVVCSEKFPKSVTSLALTGSGLLVNDSSGMPGTIHLLEDNDGDGLFLGAGESTLWSTQSVYNENTTSALRPYVP